MEAENARVQVLEGSATVRLSGQVRVDSAEELRQQLLAAEITRELALDWSEAEHVDASVLQVLIANRQQLASRGVPFVLDRDNGGIREFLKVSGLSDYFPLKSRIVCSS